MNKLLNANIYTKTQLINYWEYDDEGKKCPTFSMVGQCNYFASYC